jgi:hypothetical protein
MIQFNHVEPLFRLKQPDVTVQDLCGLLRVHLNIGNTTLFKSYYTRLDQSYMVWGVALTVIFATAQYSPLSWTTQAIVWSVLSLGVTSIMVALTWYWSYVEEISWLVWTWVGLMVGGLMITDYGVFTHWSFIMGHLCLLWLGISSIGYWITGWGLKSRAFLLMGLVHGLSCFALPYVLSWQFLFTGLTMAISLFALGEYQWDIRLPIEYKRLSLEEQQHNRELHQRNQNFALQED